MHHPRSLRSSFAAAPIPYREPREAPAHLWRRDPPDTYADDARRALIDPLVAVARLAHMAPVPEAVFVDPLTRERIGYAPAECDAYGAALVGADEHHVWVGTLRALLVIDGDTRYFEVWGYLGAEDWCGRLAASSEDAVERYLERLGVVDFDIEALSLQELQDE